MPMSVPPVNGWRSKYGKRTATSRIMFTGMASVIIIQESGPLLPNFDHCRPLSEQDSGDQPSIPEFRSLESASPFLSHPSCAGDARPRGLSTDRVHATDTEWTVRGHRVHGAYVVGCIVCMQRMRGGAKRALRVRRMHTITQTYVPCTRSAEPYVRAMHTIDGLTRTGRARRTPLCTLHAHDDDYKVRVACAPAVCGYVSCTRRATGDPRHGHRERIRSQGAGRSP